LNAKKYSKELGHIDPSKFVLQASIKEEISFVPVLI